MIDVGDDAEISYVLHILTRVSRLKVQRSGFKDSSPLSLYVAGKYTLI